LLPGVPPGTIIGHEFVGVIAEAGSGVQRFKPGDRVAVPPATWCGTCASCKRQESQHCPHGGVWGGGEIFGKGLAGAQAPYVRVPLEEALEAYDLFENHWLPVVNYDKEVNDYFYDPDRGPKNVWEYFFEPVMGFSYAVVEDLLRKGELSEAELHVYPAELMWEWHRFDPDRVATFWHDEPPREIPVSKSPRRNRISSLTASRLARSPEDRLSATVTSAPLCRSSSVSALPMKEAPPVTRTFKPR